MRSTFFARLKLLILLITSSLTIFIKDLPFLIFFLFLLLLTSARFKLTSRLFPRVTSLLLVGLLVIGFHLFFNTTATIPQRIILGSSAASRILILSILVFLYTATSSPSEIVTALSFLPKEIQLMLTITLSLIPLVFSESQNIILIQSVRGYKSKSINIVKSVIPLIIPLIHRTLARAEQITLILQTRGFHGN